MEGSTKMLFKGHSAVEMIAWKSLHGDHLILFFLLFFFKHRARGRSATGSCTPAKRADEGSYKKGEKVGPYECNSLEKRTRVHASSYRTDYYQVPYMDRI